MIVQLQNCEVPLWSYIDLFKYCVVGERIAYLVGANFTPHVITVNAGEVCLEFILNYLYMCHITRLHPTSLEAWVKLPMPLSSHMILGNDLVFLPDDTFNEGWFIAILQCLFNEGWFIAILQCFLIICVTFLWFHFVIGCHNEGHVLFSARSSCYLHSFCKWYNLKCYTSSTYFFWWYSNIWGAVLNPLST